MERKKLNIIIKDITLYSSISVFKIIELIFIKLGDEYEITINPNKIKDNHSKNIILDRVDYTIDEIMELINT